MKACVFLYVFLRIETNEEADEGLWHIGRVPNVQVVPKLLERAHAHFLCSFFYIFLFRV
jgi:hypothetical protein